MRINDAFLSELITHSGELRTGPVHTFGVLRLALDLKDARSVIAELRSQIEEYERMPRPSPGKVVRAPRVTLRKASSA